MIRMFHVHKRYERKHAIQDLTLDIDAGEWTFITGPSGAGKSTLLKLLYLGEHISEGQVLIDGVNLTRVENQQVPFLRRKFGIIFQDFKLIPTKTAFENVALVLEAAGEKPNIIKKKVNNVLRNAGMESKLKSFPPGLSGGEQQRVAVARAIVGDPQIILADEPTGSLDPKSAGIIMDLLKGYHQKGATIIIATHDRNLIENTDKRIIRLDSGKLVTSNANSDYNTWGTV